VTTERRLAKVEASLTPLELIRRWLGEAHRYDDFTAYAQARYPKGIEGLPLDRLVREARESAATAGRGRSHEERSKAAQTAMRQTVFLYQLVLRIWVLAEESLERELLRYAALSAYLALALSDHSILGSRTRRSRSSAGPRSPGRPSCGPSRPPGRGSRRSTSRAPRPSTRPPSAAGQSSAS
jgi:hypothetical protein